MSDLVRTTTVPSQGVDTVEECMELRKQRNFVSCGAARSLLLCIACAEPLAPLATLQAMKQLEAAQRDMRAALARAQTAEVTLVPLCSERIDGVARAPASMC
jgi:hypothetical protein